MSAPLKQGTYILGTGGRGAVFAKAEGEHLLLTARATVRGSSDTTIRLDADQVAALRKLLT